MTQPEPIITHWEDLGDGTVAVIGVTAQRQPLSIVVGRDKLGTPELRAMIARRAARIDADYRALRAADVDTGTVGP